MDMNGLCGGSSQKGVVFWALGNMELWKELSHINSGSDLFPPPTEKRGHSGRSHDHICS